MPMKGASTPRRRLNVLYDTTVMKGGWDQLTPVLALPASYMRGNMNFEVSQVRGGGYRRIVGYERFDGHPSPSAAAFVLVQVSSYTNTPSVGQTLTGMTSGATGVIAALVTVTNFYMVLTKTTGTFVVGETVKVGATVIGTTIALTVILTPKLIAQYKAASADQYRPDISKVPGSGPVRGVFGLVVAGVDNTYAFRDNVGGTATILYKATPAGWVAVTFYNEVGFNTGGTVEPADGETLTQGAVSATIKRTVTQSGTWAGTTAAGRFIITNPTGGNFTAGAATASGGATVNLTGAQTAITLAPGGKVETDEYNFKGQAFNRRVYGADGVNRGWEFDGSVLVPIVTGTSPDTPKHVRQHVKHLFFSFLTSAIHSAPGFPYRWGAVDGASEIGCGDLVTNFLNQPGGQTTGALLITTFSEAYVLYGTGVVSWNLVPFNTGIGGIDYSAQQMNQSYWMDRPGVRSFKTTLAFGNFDAEAITHNIQDFIDVYRTKVAYSALYRPKSSHRIYFTDGAALYLTVVDGELFGSAQIVFPDIMFCAWSGVRSDGTEVLFTGSENGYVYQQEKGTSFDGATLDAFFILNWNAMKSQRMLKRFRRAAIECDGNSFASISYGYALGYASQEVPQPSDRSYTTGFSGTPVWDTFTWDQFDWDGKKPFPTEVEVFGTAENIQHAIRTTTNYIESFSVYAITTHFSPRRGIR